MNKEFEFHSHNVIKEANRVLDRHFESLLLAAPDEEYFQFIHERLGIQPFLIDPKREDIRLRLHEKTTTVATDIEKSIWLSDFEIEYLANRIQIAPWEVYKALPYHALPKKDLELLQSVFTYTNNLMHTLQSRDREGDINWERWINVFEAEIGKMNSYSK